MTTRLNHLERELTVCRDDLQSCIETLVRMRDDEIADHCMAAEARDVLTSITAPVPCGTCGGLGKLTTSLHYDGPNGVEKCDHGQTVCYECHGRKVV